MGEEKREERKYQRLCHETKYYFIKILFVLIVRIYDYMCQVMMSYCVP